MRDAVWDVLHGREPSCSRLRDVDVAYFDPASCGAERDLSFERRLRELVPSVAWDVKNQARMYERNGDERYRDCADAIGQWPETATAIGARLADGVLELCAPHCVVDRLGMVVRLTPRFYAKLPIYRARRRAKDWATRCPADVRGMIASPIPKPIGLGGALATIEPMARVFRATAVGPLLL